MFSHGPYKLGLGAKAPVAPWTRYCYLPKLINAPLLFMFSSATILMISRRYFDIHVFALPTKPQTLCDDNGCDYIAGTM